MVLLYAHVLLEEELGGVAQVLTLALLLAVLELLLLGHVELGAVRLGEEDRLVEDSDGVVLLLL